MQYEDGPGQVYFFRKEDVVISKYVSDDGGVFVLPGSRSALVERHTAFLAANLTLAGCKNPRTKRGVTFFKSNDAFVRRNTFHGGKDLLFTNIGLHFLGITCISKKKHLFFIPVIKLVSDADQ